MAELNEILVWVLMHSLWQGMLIVCGVALILHCLPAKRAETRYATAVAGLASVVLAVLVTWSVLGLEAPDDRTNSLTPVAAPVAVSQQSKPALPAHELPSISEAAASPVRSVASHSVRPSWTNWIAGLWMIGATVMLLRTLISIVEVRQWRTVLSEKSQSGLEQIQTLLVELSQHLHLRRAVMLLLSDRVKVPAVVGTLWPCILIPPALLTQIPLEQWRIILAHELAHIRRLDALVNLVQMMIESLLFFNPAVWWLSRQIRVEREACCDALAVEVCGQPISVARTLVEFAAGLKGDARWPISRTAEQVEQPSTVQSNAILAFADPTQDGELTDRVQRLVQPEIAARPRMSWIGLAIVLCSLILTFEALHWGTTIAVETAAKLMSPRERVEKLEKLQAEAQGVFLPPEPEADTIPQQDVSNSPEMQQEKCQVTLVVRAADGSPLPKDLRVGSYSRNGNSSSTGTLDSLSNPGVEFRKAYPFSPSELKIGIENEHYAPAATETITILPGDRKRTVELILDQGRTVKMQLRDPQDRPVPKAQLKFVGVLTTRGGGSSSLGTQELQTDDQGNVDVSRIGKLPYDITVKAPGFQRQVIRANLGSADTRRIEMLPANPVQLTVFDQLTGRPVANAKAVAISLQRANSTHSFGNPRRDQIDKWNVYAETDTDGKAVLDELDDSIRYTMGITAQGYAMTLLEGLHAGQDPVTVRLSPPLKLAGRIEGDLSRLPKVSRNGVAPPRWSLNYSQRMGNMTYAMDVPVDESGRFEINDLMQNERLSVHPPGGSVDFVMTKSITDAVLKIDPAPANSTALRKVIIRLTGTAPMAPARGKVWVSWQHLDSIPGTSDVGNHLLQRNEVQLSIPVGARLYIRPEHLVGYLFDEQNDLAVAAGTTPQIISIPVQPAGGIHGTITRADGSAATGAFIRVFATKLPAGVKEDRINPSTASASSNYLAPLPIGGKYFILARETGETHNLWTVSKEITLDSNHPIAEANLQFPKGRDVGIKVLEPDGKPAVNQNVAINLGFSITKGHSNGLDLRAITDRRGIATFADTAFDADISPLTLMTYVEVSSSNFIGWRGPLIKDDTMVISLVKGLSAKGVVIEAKSGKPIPMANVRLAPRIFDYKNFNGRKETTTDSKGEFQFDGLESTAYTVYVDEAVPKGTIIKEQPDGNTQFQYPDGVEQPQLDPRDSTVSRIEVQLTPNSRLKPAE